MRLFGEQFAMGVLRNPVAAITAGIGAAGSIVGGVNSANAATAAANTENNAAQNNAVQIQNQTAANNAVISNAAASAGAGVASATETGQTGVSNAAATGVNSVQNAASQANGALNPYAAAGSTAAGQLNQVAANGNQQPTMAQLQLAPNYQFQLQQGEQALQRSAAATGGALSGGNAKASTDFAIQDAGQAYQQAFNNFETAQQNNVSNLMGISNAGQNASLAQGANTQNAAVYGSNLGYNAAQYNSGAGINAATYAGNTNIAGANLTSQLADNAAGTAAQYRQTGANAIASGQLGRAAGINQAIGGSTNALTGFLANPAALGYSGGGSSVPASALTQPYAPGAALPSDSAVMYGMY